MQPLLIAAGHSNTDPGACANGQQEAALALELRDMVAAYLRQAGRDVTEDGADGVNLPLTEAIRLAKGRFAVEIHFNAASPSAGGVECIAPVGLRYQAQKLAQATASALKIKPRGDAGYTCEAQSQHKRLGFVRAGGLILEVCFITNATEMAWYLAQKHALARTLAATLDSLTR